LRPGITDAISRHEEEAMGLMNRTIERLAGVSDRLDHLYRRRRGSDEDEESSEPEGGSSEEQGSQSEDEGAESEAESSEEQGSGGDERSGDGGE
jgi:hypothetical protein